MISRIWNMRSLAISLVLAFLALAVQFALSTAYAEEQMGQLTVVGQVKLNDRPAATGDIVASGSGVQTAKGSSAVVSLGKLGRVEALPETRMMLRYDERNISIVIEKGSVRVDTGEGVTATIKLKEK